MKNKINEILALLDSKDRAPKSKIRPLLYEMLIELRDQEPKQDKLKDVIQRLKRIEDKIQKFR